jgi:putative lipoprotein
MRLSAFLAFLTPIAALAGTITGSVSHRERIALPDDATVVVRLEQGARFGRPGRVISEVQFVTGGSQSPFAYSLPYSDAAVRGGTFGLRAEIWVDGRLRFASAEAVPMGDRARVDIVVSHAAVPVSLQGTKWMLTELNGRPALGDTAFLRLADGSAGGNTGVNVFGGEYTLRGRALNITPGQQTMIAGTPEMMEQERAFLRALDEATTFRVSASSLVLIAGNRIVARFKPSSE